MRTKVLLSTVALTAGMLAVPVTPASAVDNINSYQLTKAVTVNGILGHARALQRIANANDGNRAAGTPGYEASARYVERVLVRAGYDVTWQPFEFAYEEETTPTSFVQTAPAEEDYAAIRMTYSGNGSVTGSVEEIDPAPFPSTSGCEASDFAGFTAGAIALVHRGTCPFAQKAVNAEAAGAAGVVVANAGEADPETPLNGTLGEAGIVDIPVVGVSQAAGEQIAAAADGGEFSLNVDVLAEQRTTWNILADSPTGDPARTVVVGAHLDSVGEGAGINDNGSGTATILEIAEEMSELGVQNRQRIRFAFWGAEELGLLGAEHYVANLSDTELDQTYANLNFDMLGSKNYVPFVYDGDGSAFGTAGPPGSDAIETVFTDYLQKRAGGSVETAFDGRSDYGPFIAAGIPAGGLFSGAEEIKTEEQAATFGGTAGEAYDDCYHTPCDDISSLNTDALAELGDAAAHATYVMARTRTGLFPDLSRRGEARPLATTTLEGAA